MWKEGGSAERGEKNKGEGKQVRQARGDSYEEGWGRRASEREREREQGMFRVLYQNQG